MRAMSTRSHILLVEDDRDVLRAVGVRLRAAGFETIVAHDGEAGLAAARVNLPDAIVLDIRMPGMDGLTVLARLREEEGTRDIPVVVLSANVVETVKCKALDLGAKFFLQKPYDPKSLVQAIQTAISSSASDRGETSEERPDPPGNVKKYVLIADADPLMLHALTKRCRALDLDVQTVKDGLEALLLCSRDTPELLIVDAGLPGADGLVVCDKLRRSEPTASIPIIVLSSKSDERTKLRCTSLGAQYIYKGPEFWNELAPTIRTLLNIEPRDAATSKMSITTPGPAAAAPRSAKVLAIDDDYQITRAIMIRLGALGIEVIGAPNAKMGQLLAKKEQPDVIITDYQMPAMSGEQLLVNLKKDPETNRIPVIMITGQKIEGMDNHALKREMLGRRGAAAYLSKPLEFDSLLDELRRFIELPRESGPVRRFSRLAAGPDPAPDRR